MRIKFWGTRGSIPTPGSNTIRYGGNTSCVELRSDDGTLFILDCGTGLRRLGQKLLQEKQPISGIILLSHTHWDHTQGFAFFDPIFQKGNQFTIFAVSGVDRSLSEVLSGQMDYLYFPLTLDELESTILFKEIGEETFNVGDVQVRTQFTNHTVLTLGFRIKAGGRTVVYVADHEPFSTNLYRAGVENPSLEDIIHAGDRRHVEFLTDADLVIHDAQYTNAEYLDKRNWGHSTMEYVLDVAMAANVRQVVLSHHDPDHDDDFLDALEAHCQDQVRAVGSNMNVLLAAEGLEIFLPEAADQVPEDMIVQTSATRFKPARILIADDDPSLVRYIEAVLRKDKYELLSALNGEEAVQIALSEQPDLILLDVMMPKLSGYEVAKQLREKPEFQETPIIMFTARAEEEDIVRSFESGVNDYIGKPAAPSLLRSRVRRWLMRSDQNVDEQQGHENTKNDSTTE
jgi:CheY-like chemotaxis protein/glyoxylase-like metal-dependent hydrolase (beta-lactamase superfamily II)